MNLSEEAMVRQIRNLLIINLHETGFGQSDICLELGLSRTTLYRILKKNTSLSVSIFIRNIRLKKAKDLLINSPLRISEIAYEVGFSNPQDFSKYFKAEYDTCPRAFRNKTKETAAFINAL